MRLMCYRQHLSNQPPVVLVCIHRRGPRIANIRQRDLPPVKDGHDRRRPRPIDTGQLRIRFKGPSSIPPCGGCACRRLAVFWSFLFLREGFDVRVKSQEGAFESLLKAAALTQH